MATAQVFTPDPAHHLSKKPIVATEAIALTPMDLLSRAYERGADIAQLERLTNLVREWKKDAAREAFVAAMSSFKANPPQVLKNATAAIRSDKGNYEYSYATLDQVCRAIVHGLSAVGITHRWLPAQQGSVVTITCILTHELGHSEQASLSGPVDQSGGKNAIQAVGSTVTYLERYTLLAVSGFAAGGTDTDGRAPALNGSATIVNSTPNAIKGDRVEEMTGELRRASNFEQLQKMFQLAYSEASKAGDSAAQAAYIAAKDQRRRELRTNGNR